MYPYRKGRTTGCRLQRQRSTPTAPVQLVRGDAFDMQAAPLRSWYECLIGSALTETQSAAQCGVTASLSLDAVWRAVPNLLMVDAEL